MSKPTNVIASVRSMSDRRRRYALRLTAANKIQCTCPAWHFKGGKPCKHVHEWKRTNPDWKQDVRQVIASR